MQSRCFNKYAGVGVSKSSELSIDDFLSVFNVNVFGLALFTKEISKYMIDESYGTIINIGSTASLKNHGRFTHLQNLQLDANSVLAS